MASENRYIGTSGIMWCQIDIFQSPKVWKRFNDEGGLDMN